MWLLSHQNLLQTMFKDFRKFWMWFFSDWLGQNSHILIMQYRHSNIISCNNCQKIVSSSHPLLLLLFSPRTLLILISHILSMAGNKKSWFTGIKLAWSKFFFNYFYNCVSTLHLSPALCLCILLLLQERPCILNWLQTAYCLIKTVAMVIVILHSGRKMQCGKNAKSGIFDCKEEVNTGSCCHYIISVWTAIHCFQQPGADSC